MHREVSKLAAILPNLRLVSKRYSTIWGGASLLTMLLSALRELLAMPDWTDWDFVLNLSESDFPVKTQAELVSFLSSNRGSNFVKSHGREQDKFIKKQGLDRTFHECDTHMWRLGNRELPLGLQIDGGSDWICLNRCCGTASIAKHTSTTTFTSPTGRGSKGASVNTRPLSTGVVAARMTSWRTTGQSWRGRRRGSSSLPGSLRQSSTRGWSTRSRTGSREREPSQRRPKTRTGKMFSITRTPNQV